MRKITLDELEELCVKYNLQKYVYSEYNQDESIHVLPISYELCFNKISVLKGDSSICLSNDELGFVRIRNVESVFVDDACIDAGVIIWLNCYNIRHNYRIERIVIFAK